MLIARACTDYAHTRCLGINLTPNLPFRL